MAAGAYQKCKKTQGDGIWAEVWTTSVERSKGYPAAALLENGPQLRPSAQRHCGRPDGSRGLESHSTPSTGGHYRRGMNSFWDRGEHESKAASHQISRNRKVRRGGVDVEGAVFGTRGRDHVRRVLGAFCGLPRACDSTVNFTFTQIQTVGDGYRICSSLRRPPIAGVTLLHKCIKRVTCHLFHNHALLWVLGSGRSLSR
jgi:hypothetical protein